MKNFEIQQQKTSAPNAQRRQPRDKASANDLFSSLPFIVALPIAFLFLELIVHIAAFGGLEKTFFVYATFFSFAGGMLAALLCTIFGRKVNYIICLVLIGAATLLCGIQIVYSDFFGDFFQLATLGMAGNILDFMESTLLAIFSNLHWILLLFIPIVVFAVFGRSTLAPERVNWMLRSCCAVFALGFFMLGTLYVNSHDDTFGDKYIYGEGFQVKDSIGKFGVLTTARLELQYMIFGTPVSDVGEIPEILEGDATTALQGGDIFSPKDTTSPDTGEVSPPDTDEATGGASGEVSGDITDGETTAPPPPPPEIDRSPQKLDIDFEKLIAEAKAAGKNNLAKAHSFFASRAGTNKHEYTGLFEGKNLIYITVEAWAPAAINEKLTPTLYMMKNEGFVFDNFYCSLWGGSTATGEYANITGNFYYSASCLRSSINTYQPYTLGNMFSKAGYSTDAFHNHLYEYYGRDKSHPNFGYDWHAVGNWDVNFTDEWPKSDYELAINSLPYLTADKPFHLYYMTVSGHANQTFIGNSQASKHRSYVTSVIGNDYKEQLSLSFISCQYEVELMIKALYDECERLGILEDTVFVLAPDHFPYKLSANETENQAALAEMYGLPNNDIYNNFDLYRAPLIIWSGSMKEPVKVDKVCSAIDILPTLLNLFGMEYDSRLIIGRDILDAGAEGIVPLNTSKTSYHFITDYGEFDFTTKKFKVAEGYSVDPAALETYVSQKRDELYYLRIYSPYILDNDYYRIVFPNG